MRLDSESVDAVHGPSHPPPPIHNVSTSDGDSQLAIEIAKLREEVAYIKKIVRSNSRSPSSRGHRSHSPRSDRDSPARGRPPVSAGTTSGLGTRLGSVEALLFSALGKRSGQPLMATGVAGQSTPSRLFRIYDSSTTLSFLIDTGAEVSVITPSVLKKQCQQELTLQAANNSSIATYGKKSLTLDLGLRRTFQWVFVTANVTVPILGADFLRHFGLLVDMQHHRLIDNNRGERSASKSTSIQTTGPPIHSATRRLPPVKLEIANSIICCSWGLLGHHQAVGPHHCIWYLRSQGIGVLVETTTL